MSVFGVSPEEEEMYRHFLRNPDTPVEDIHLRLHTDRASAQRALRRLYDFGLLRQPTRDGAPDDKPGGVLPISPEIAVSRLMDRRMHELHEELLRVTQSRHVIDALRAETGARVPPPQGIEQLGDLAQIRSRIDDLAFFARDEILSVEPYTELSPENIEHARPLDMRCLRRGIRIRSVVLSKALKHAPTAGYLRELAAQGAMIRVADDVSERLLVYDRRTALVPVDPEQPSRGALLAYESGLVANIIALFEKIWDQAGDLPAATGDVPVHPATGDSALSEMEQRVLRSMVSAGKDEAGARDLGISVRTYRRHVADLMRGLGAASRAQAALLAREHGWI
ncbi:LuxR C-terminal-related transcriptional regulator [Streptomyces sp. N2-109]|uniref:LuxR C-terminal-related transcriptional regulator n=1 Tax=Streptomyces gossypii TaxID=2883101 RepID=A0ABT2JP87_9ACTN|nr:LuxR C-terminal-related transcriptional regulator [Streptomyces gossypii]MCT2589692.1 LuxR C-terminal-related transcriptional regulator [Streptomyces gossypii]